MNRFHALVTAKAALFAYVQDSGQNTTDYYEAFCEHLDVLEAYGGKLHDPAAAAPESANISALNDKEKDTYMRERYSGCLLILNADPRRFEKLRERLADAFSVGRDEYPDTLVAAHKLLLTYEQTHFPSSPPRNPSSSHRRRRRGGGNGNGGGRSSGRGDGGQNDGGRGNGGGRSGGRGGTTGRSFAQIASGANASNDSPTADSAPCSTASIAHESPIVPSVQRQVAICLQQHAPFPDGIPNHYVLLDSDSTVSIFNNADFLTDIHDVDAPLCLTTNGGGSQVTAQMGTLAGIGPVW